MQFKLYCVYDEVARQFGPIFQAVNDGVAARSVVRMMEKVPSYDRDAYTLFTIGSFDDEKGDVSGCEKVKVNVNIPRFDDVEQRNFGFKEMKDA